MSSEWMFPVAAIPFLLIVIPLIFLAAAFYSRLRNAWSSHLLWHGLRCPVRKTAERVGFLEENDELRNQKTIDVVYCTAFADPSQVQCGKECLHESQSA